MMSGGVIRIVLINSHTVVCPGCQRPFSATAMHLTKTILDKLSLIRQNVANDCKLLYIAARHGQVDLRDPAGARGIYRVPPQGVPS